MLIFGRLLSEFVPSKAVKAALLGTALVADAGVSYFVGQQPKAGDVSSSVDCQRQSVSVAMEAK